MSHALTEAQPVSHQTLEHVLGTGDLSKLSVQQRVEYYARTCQSLGLNPLTRPFRFLSLNGQIQLYATRDCTDQLRKINGITLHIVDKTIDGDLFLVTVRARTKDGREDEDMAAVTLGRLQGESRANALMKAMTKAKRRVTLSICGLGLTDESELDTMPGAQAFDADTAPPDPRREQINREIPVAAAATPRAPRIAAKEPPAANGNGDTDERWQSWLVKLRDALGVVRTEDVINDIMGKPTVLNALHDGPDWVQREITALSVDALKRVRGETDDDWPRPDPNTMEQP